MTTFFEHQVAAKRRTWLLVAYFLLAVFLIISTIYLAVMVIFVSQQVTGEPVRLWNPETFELVSAAVLAVVAAGSFYKMAFLSGGGARVAESLGGLLIQPNTNDYHEKRLINVVEEIAIASGIPVPQIYVLVHEEGINAFAAGTKPSNAAIGVSDGCMRLLTRDELQGVIAHEFSHILNGDMRLNIKLIGILHGILLLGITGYWLLRSGASGSRSRSSRNSGGGGLIAFGFVLFAVGYIGVFFGNLIKAAVSRQREFLADASAVQFTRNASGISGALKKIGGFVRGSRIQASHAQEASHMYFANGIARAFLGLLATHPPIDERIKRIEPSFRGEFGDFSNLAPVIDTPSESQAGAVSQLSAASAPPVERIAVTTSTVVEQVGAPTSTHLAFASHLLAKIPHKVLEGAREPSQARAIVFFLLLDQAPTVRRKQLDILLSGADHELSRLVVQFAELMPSMPANYRLPLVDLCIPALRMLSPSQWDAFRQTLQQLVEADNQYSLFEYALHHILLRHVDSHFKRTGEKKPAASVTRLDKAAAALIGVLATLGQASEQLRASAFECGLAELRIKETYSVDDSNMQTLLKTLDDSLNILAGALPHYKERIIRACTAAISTDGQVTVEESELLRTIGDALDCPIPPLTAS